MIDDDVKCRWCGRSYREHVIYRSRTEPWPGVPCGLLKASFLPVPERDARARCASLLMEIRDVLVKGETDYLAVHTAWSHARRAMEDFLDNPDWLEDWINDSWRGDLNGSEKDGEAEKAESLAAVESRA